ncbi:PEP/pyruvate-binding domain-containing protein [Bacteroidota bacterium]
MNPPKIINPPTIDFDHTAFKLLMQKRIGKVLLICSNYDAFMLEQDGRIDEQIFNEYVSLNLRYPPTFLQAYSSKEAFSILESNQIDLVIEMLNIEDTDPFELARKIKSQNADIPIVILTHFSREVTVRIQHEDLSAIDYVFSWLGTADLLLAIIKLIEDKMNVEHDVEMVGVQTILLVEDSVRFISSYLPVLYKVILKQAKGFALEALNEHQRMLRMRGRPKVLLASTFDDAVELFQKYKFNMLGIISDVNFKKNVASSEKGRMGLEFFKLVRSEDEFMPFLLQSSDASMAVQAKKLGIGFLHKYSKNLSHELTGYIVKNFAFGDFVFREAETLKKVGRAKDLQSLQHEILRVPASSIELHSSKNDFSKWLNARAIFPVAQLFKYLRLEDFETTEDMRNYLFESISNFRISKGRGIIAKFDREKFDEYLLFTRIGDDSIGGKARGLAFINSVIEKHHIFNKYPDVVVTIPRTVVLSTDIFDEYMESNELYKIALSDLPDDKILEQFLSSKLPGWVIQDLKSFVQVLENPVAVRSSSKLEDSHYQPFAGIYSTYMVPCDIEDRQHMVTLLSKAIKSVYASVFYKSSKAYMTATSNVIDEEKMGIILQEVCGTSYAGRFYPTLSGVARSINFYPIEPEKAEDGIAVIAYGLGKYLMDGGAGLRFSPKYPKKILQLSSPELVLKDTQKQFFAVNLDLESFVPAVDDGENLLKLKFKDAEKDASFKYAASTYDFENEMIRDGIFGNGKRVITFSPLLNYNEIPLAEILSDLLQTCQKEMNNPIEIEFAVNLDTPSGEPAIFNFLQVRPIVLNDQQVNFSLDNIVPEETIIYSESALGNGSFPDLHDIVYVKPSVFDAAHSEKIAGMIEEINDSFIEQEKNYILIGPGRWGSSDPWLGIPTKWTQLSAARVIIEAGLENYRIDPSQGTHFFQNITSFRIGYFTINPFIDDGHYDLDFLDAQPAAMENDLIRQVHFENPLRVEVDGKKNKGVIYKPLIISDKPDKSQ